MQHIGRYWIHLFTNRKNRLLRIATFFTLFLISYIAIFLIYQEEKTSQKSNRLYSEMNFDLFAGSLSGRLPSVCQNLSCKADYLRSAGDLHPIPAIRHLMWINESVSEYFADQLRSWKRIHPDWTVVLWRDQDLAPFVKKYFPGALKRFHELEPHRIMQVDMIRYMLLYKFGGVYADLDYTLISSLDEYRRFHALITIEPEAHSLQFLGFHWPPRLFANPAFMASAPMHPFFRYCIEQLQTISYKKGDPLMFAGPIGLASLMEYYSGNFSVANFPIETIYVPPSYSFYPYENNRLNSSKTNYGSLRFKGLNSSCVMHSNVSSVLIQYCKDINNLDPITDSSQPIVAVHDMQKSGPIYDKSGTQFYLANLTSMYSVFKDLQIGEDWI